MKFIIISLKHGTPQQPMFWRANNAGYTTSPFAAGIYTDEQVKAEPHYYNDGYSAIAVPLTDAGMDKIGFKCSFDLKGLEELHRASQRTTSGQKL